MAPCRNIAAAPLAKKRALTSLEIARAVYAALTKHGARAFISEFSTHDPVTIDGRFNLSKVAADLRRELNV